jgi:F-type H+-transporting ATPase subunit alpha
MHSLLASRKLSLTVPFSALWRRYTSHSAASEVSTILESRISGAAVAANVEETGRVLSMCLASTL